MTFAEYVDYITTPINPPSTPLEIDASLTLLAIRECLFPDMPEEEQVEMAVCVANLAAPAEGGGGEKR